jgi:hypothetical protein
MEFISIKSLSGPNKDLARLISNCDFLSPGCRFIKDFQSLKTSSVSSDDVSSGVGNKRRVAMATLHDTSLNTCLSSGKAISTHQFTWLIVITRGLTITSWLEIRTLSFSNNSDVGRTKE